MNANQSAHMPDFVSVSARVVRGCSPELLAYRNSENALPLIQQNMAFGVPSQVLERGHVIAFLREGKNRFSLASYRPIALTSCLCKLLER